jgi:hypothetical protein
MAYYAILDENNIVVQVIVGRNENDTYNDQPMDWEAYYGGKRTSYNTKGGVHLLGGVPFRKNYAGIGFTYDLSRDAFIPPKPYPSWSLNEQTCIWDAPLPHPNDGKDYAWDEQDQQWVAIIADGQTPVEHIP